MAQFACRRMHPARGLSQSSFYLTIEDIAQVDDAGNPGLMEQFAGS